MPYYLRGNLWGYICRECPRPLWGVVVRAYAAEGERILERAVADPKQTAAAIDEKAVNARSGRLLAEAEVGEDGSFELDFSRSKYDGGAVEIDLRTEGLPRIDERTAKSAPRQIQLTTLQPAWREREKDFIAFWEYYLPSRLWCMILSWFDLWVICGRVTVCATGQPVGGVIVKAFDRDWLQDDALGSATTDATGRFVLYYAGADFRETIFSPNINIEWTGGPDLYFRVETMSATPLLIEPPGRARQPDRENVGNCFCVELCLDKQPTVVESFPAFTAVGFYEFLTMIDSGSGGGGLTLGDHRAFYSTNRLNGVMSKKLNGNAMEYMFEYQTTDSAGNNPGPWLPVTPAMIDPTVIGKWEIFDPQPPFPDPNPVKHMPYMVRGTAGPNVKVAPMVGNWIQVPQESDVLDVTVGNFAPNNNLINLISSSLATFTPLNMAGVLAGSSTTSAGASLAANKYFGLRMLVHEVGSLNPPIVAGYLRHYAVNDTTYSNVVHHPAWAGHTDPPGTLGINMVDIQELITVGCAEIQNSLTILITAAHPTMGTVSLGMIGNAFSGTFTLPAAVPGEQFGTVTNNFSVPNLPPCAYIVTLSTQLLLTTGDGVPSNLVDQIAFCKAPPP
jgi:hypothetical protein